MGEGRDGVAGVGFAGGFVGDPEDAGALEKLGAAGFGEKFLPERESAEGPARVNFVGTVAHANDAGFAAGTGAGVGGAVGVDKKDRGAGFSEAVGDPGTEDAGADDGDVVGRGFSGGH
ncbi:MAG TPA: hypothetical protein VKS01_02435 [Bryobacteraceae bacterium]|nr:hypothetical protein [Bryobacteraceae bacterium]